MSDNPYNTQHGGTHYVNMGMQPFRFAMVNGWDAGAFSILKYLSRHRTKNGLEDLKKARHFVDLRIAEIEDSTVGSDVISMETYIHKNTLSGGDATALLMLNDWVKTEEHLPLIMLIETIDQLMAEYSPTPLP